MPKSQVDNVVTPSVLRMDKRSCENLLEAILEEKREEDRKKQIIQSNRQDARNKLKLKHN